MSQPAAIRKTVSRPVIFMTGMATGVLFVVIVFSVFIIAQPLFVTLRIAEATKVATSEKIAPETIDKIPLTNLPPEQQFGHHHYEQTNEKTLVLVGSYGLREYERYEYLQEDAAKAFLHMQHAAREQGVWIVVISGFRDYARQQKLFEKQIQRLGSEAAAVRLSAPPGYSEHHTGYTLDVGDGFNPKQDLKTSFEQTKVYRWLQHNALTFGFELSFPKDNLAGVAYEPWHWRYVGSPKPHNLFHPKEHEQQHT